jgi:5-methylcytosine-specific restriction endonuclease McrA
MADAIVLYAGPIITVAEARAAGLKRYFTGKPCPYGHISERRTSNWKCIECGLEEFREWSKSNPEKVREKTKKWRDANPDWVSQYQRSWERRNADRIRDQRKIRELPRLSEIQAYRRAYYESHKSHYRAQSREWQRKNKEKVKLSNYRWRERNPEAFRAITQRRRAKKSKAEGSYTARDLIALFKSQKGLCNGCLKSLPKSYHVDHIMPLCRGGSNWPSNLQLLCQSCNSSKGTKTMDEWLDRINRKKLAAA